MKFLLSKKGSCGGSSGEVTSYRRKCLASNKVRISKAQHSTETQSDTTTLLGSLMAKWLLDNLASDILLKKTTLNQSAVCRLQDICSNFTASILKAPLRTQIHPAIHRKCNFKFDLTNAIERKYQARFHNDPNCTTIALAYMKCRYD